MIVPSPVTTLNSGRVTEPVDIMTVFESAVILFCCGTIPRLLISSDDPVDIDPESGVSTRRVVPVSVDHVDIEPESIESGMIIAHVSVPPHELLAIFPVDTSENISDLVILTEISGIVVPPVIVGVSDF